MPANAATPVPGTSDSGDDKFPRFLPPYFARALEIDGKPSLVVEHTEKNNISRYVLASDDLVTTLVIESVKCDGAGCTTVFDQGMKFFNTRTSQNAGRFRTVTRTEFRADWQTGLEEASSYLFRMPNSLLFWTYSTRLHRDTDVDQYFDDLKMLVDRERYEEALADNVEMGRWDVQIRGYARELVAQGKKSEALAVLKNLLATSPFDYDAHFDFIEITPDRAAAKNSARVVYENAESAEQISRAAQILGPADPSLGAVPALERGERGLQLILIPLQPCNLRLLEEAATVYQKITDVPVKVRRLPEPWQFGAPDRIYNQRAAQQAIIQFAGPTDFTGWTVDRYGTELIKTVAAKDALSKYWMSDFVEQIGRRPGQYRSEPYLTRLVDLLENYRSDDARTMYVGVTEANIFSGENNFLFSNFMSVRGRGASILSYAVMMAKTLGEPYESRKRLVERLAKELVPASLKSLGIPRPSDPTDPYSYSDGIERVTQKTLTLSAPTKEALDKFR